MTESADAIAHDPPDDAVHPASTEAWFPTSAGERLLGVVYVPSGPGPHPAVLLLHGLPGIERNLDIAQALRRAGFVSAMCHYRGAWGSGGSFSIEHTLEDAISLVAALRTDEAVARLRVDPRRVGVFGHSLGGFAALMTTADDPDLGVVASVAGANLGPWGRRAAQDPATRDVLAAALDEEIAPLNATSGAALAAEMAAHHETWELTAHAGALATRSVLLVAGTRDTLTPPADHHEPLVAAMRGHHAHDVEQHIFDANHAFASARVALARIVVDFFTRHLARR